MKPAKEFNSKTNKTSIVRRPYPYIPSVKEKVYNAFITKVVDPTTNQYNPPLDESGYPIKMPDNGPNCRYIVNSIIRIRLLDGSERLYSMGQLIGYDGLGQRSTMGIYAPENYQNTVFGTTRKFDDQSGRIITMITSPIRQETIYTLDYNSENVQKLYEKSWDGKNPYFKPDKRNNKRVMFICKDESTGIAKEIFFSSVERSLELMKTKSFDELFTDAYLPRAVLENRKMFSSGLMEEQQKTTPTTTDKFSTGPTSTSNTSAYK
jgi:hypothetical protein